MVVRIDEDGHHRWLTCLYRLTIWTHHGHGHRLLLLLSGGNRYASNHHHGLLLDEGVDLLLLLSLCSCGHHYRLLLDKVGVGDRTTGYRLCLYYMALGDHTDLLWR